MSRSAIIRVALSLFLLFSISQTALGQIDVTEILSPSTNLEPGANTPMSDGPPTDLGDGSIVFSFKAKDTDMQADDLSDVTIDCFLVQNLGSASETEITSVMIIDGTGTAVAAPVTTAAPGGAPPAGCPAGAPGGGNISFEAYVTPAGGYTIPDNGTQTFQVAVLTAPTGILQNTAQNKTVRIQVTLQYAESIGSPPTPTTFTLAATDSDQDYVSNSGINSLTLLNFTPVPIKIGSAGVALRFHVCDKDANANSLRIDALTLSQGPLGSALIDDFDKFELYMISGIPQLWGQITSGDPGFTADFNRGGPGITLSVTPGLFIPDEQCLDFEVRATPSISALKGRVIHLRAVLSAQEPPGTDIDSSTDLIVQAANTVMLGSGVLRILDVQSPGGNLPVEVVGFSSPGLGKIEVQTQSVQFDATVVHVDGVTSVSPYQVSDVHIDNRLGSLKFTLSIDPAHLDLAKMGIPAPDVIAYIRTSKQGQPGQKSPFIFQVDRVLDVDDLDLTSQMSVISGSILLPLFGDVDLMNDGATIKDVLMLATALLGCFDEPPAITGLSDAQKLVADVALPKAATGTIPDCTTLTSADLIPIAKASIASITSSSLSTPRTSQSDREKSVLPVWLSILQRLFPGMAGSQAEPAQIKLIPASSAGEYTLQINSDGRAIGGVQGRILFDGRSTTVLKIEALGEYKILATSIDQARGEVRFLMIAPPGNGSKQSNILRLHLAASHQKIAAELRPDVQFLLSPEARDIPFTIIQQQAPAQQSAEAFSVRSINLSSTGPLWTLSVEGQGISSIEVHGFDLAGRQRFAIETEGSTLRWNALESMGDKMANGVYLFVITAKSASGFQKQTVIRKVVVVR
ncbi:hypothetical protein HY229_07955 [Candidatus Acetothermia bacterium]|nr:hypothetical protein [Candidatus Acetothermia bacterium]MBI3644013.1 hypothetical protein [Candidatus Acetothermia bacterium]